MPNQPFLGTTISLMLKDVALNDRVSSILEQCGCAVLHTNSPDGAMAAQRNEPKRIDLLIVDDTLDPKGGATLFHRMGVSQDDLIVLYITKNAHETPQIKGVAQVHFLPIPFSDDEFVAAVSQLLLSGTDVPRE